MSEVNAPTLPCPDCNGTMRMVPGSGAVFFCKPCKRFRVKEHMEKYVAPKPTVEAEFKRIEGAS